MKKVCGFYVSSMHLVTMILPNIREEINEGTKIETFFEYNLNENINKILSNLIINNEEKQKILNINWKNKKIKKYSDLEKNIKNIIEKNEKINLIISGSEKYIIEVNKILDKIFNKYKNRKYSNITIINCYEVSAFNDNIREILDLHEYIINTSGVHRIEEIFEETEDSKVQMNKAN